MDSVNLADGVVGLESIDSTVVIDLLGHLTLVIYGETRYERSEFGVVVLGIFIQGGFFEDVLPLQLASVGVLPAEPVDLILKFLDLLHEEFVVN